MGIKTGIKVERKEHEIETETEKDEIKEIPCEFFLEWRAKVAADVSVCVCV